MFYTWHLVPGCLKNEFYLWNERVSIHTPWTKPKVKRCVCVCWIIFLRARYTSLKTHVPPPQCRVVRSVRAYCRRPFRRVRTAAVNGTPPACRCDVIKTVAWKVSPVHPSVPSSFDARYVSSRGTRFYVWISIGRVNRCRCVSVFDYFIIFYYWLFRTNREGVFSFFTLWINYLLYVIENNVERNNDGGNSLKIPIKKRKKENHLLKEVCLKCFPIYAVPSVRAIKPIAVFFDLELYIYIYSQTCIFTDILYFCECFAFVSKRML